MGRAKKSTRTGRTRGASPERKGFKNLKQRINERIEREAVLKAHRKTERARIKRVDDAVTSYKPGPTMRLVKRTPHKFFYWNFNHRTVANPFSPFLTFRSFYETAKTASERYAYRTRRRTFRAVTSFPGDYILLRDQWDGDKGEPRWYRILLRCSVNFVGQVYYLEFGYLEDRRRIHELPFPHMKESLQPDWYLLAKEKDGRKTLMRKSPELFTKRVIVSDPKAHLIGR